MMFSNLVVFGSFYAWNKRALHGVTDYFFGIDGYRFQCYNLLQYASRMKYKSIMQFN
jgi:hypothetical protein